MASRGYILSGEDIIVYISLGIFIGLFLTGIVVGAFGAIVLFQRSRVESEEQWTLKAAEKTIDKYWGLLLSGKLKAKAARRELGISLGNLKSVPEDHDQRDVAEAMIKATEWLLEQVDIQVPKDG